jgi:sialate O-acetylesterase
MKPANYFTGRIALTLMLLSFFALSALPNVKLPGALSSNMVLQRNKEIRVWGWADKGEKVTVTFNNKSESAKAGNDGKWSLVLPSMKEGGPFTMTVKGKNEIKLENILLGDIWVCSGQSNMEWSLKNTNNAAKEIADANYPDIRLLSIPKNMQYVPAEDVAGIKWEVCSPESVPGFSAVGYLFGRDVYKSAGVPIGLINTSWGGTNIEAWTSADFITTVEEFKNAVSLKKTSPAEMEAARQKQLQDLCTRFGITIEKKTNTDNWNQPGIDLTSWQDMDVPGLWEAKGIGEVDGFFWFRKEVDIPEEISGKEWTLILGKIDDGDLTYVNGTLVGKSDVYTDIREYTLKPGILKPGKNLIAVRVEDTGGGGGFWSAKEDMKLVCQNKEIPLAGIWKCRLSAESLRLNSNDNPNSNPSSLFNGMINPILNLAVTGAIWYQGEANAPKAYQYRTLLPLMINCWRAKWNQPDMYFYFVQLANYMKADEQPAESDWAELREAQSMTLSLPHTGMAVITDIGEANDIHPRNKQDVGMRLSLHALKDVYGKQVVTDGPQFKSVKFDGAMALLEFNTQGSVLVANDKYGYLRGFAVAGADKKFYWAKASIAGNRVIVTCDKVAVPVAVRYAWGNNPDDANLYNTEGLPASSFRTDDWPGITFNLK